MKLLVIYNLGSVIYLNLNVKSTILFNHILSLFRVSANVNLFLSMFIASINFFTKLFAC